MVNKSAKKLTSNQRNRWLEVLATDASLTATGRLRVVIDTNVWYSALLYGGTPELVVRYCRRHCTVVISPYITSELLGLLKEFGAPYRWRNSLESLIKRQCELVEPEDLGAFSRDPKDDPVIATAIAGNCAYLVTGDMDLLSLKRHDQIEIVTPKQLLDLVEIN